VPSSKDNVSRPLRALPDAAPIGLALAGGSGLRARPLTLRSPDFQRSKAAITLAGRSLIDWEVDMLARQGVTRFYVVAKGLENRTQIKSILGHGEPRGLSVGYSRPRFDAENTGSGQATLRALEHWKLDGLALVFPTDSLFDFDLDEMVAAHRAQNAVVTVASVARSPEEAAEKYGVLSLDGPRVLGFREKPGLAEAVNMARGAAHRDGMVDVNAGLYLIDCTRLRALAGLPRLRHLVRTGLDWGGQLLPFLAGHGRSVAAHRIARFGDLGTPQDYLETLGDLLRGKFPLLDRELGDEIAVSDSVRIHQSSLHLADLVTGRTLAQKLAAGEVRIGPNVRIGRDVEIGAGVWVENSDIGDGVDIGAGAVVRGSACADHAMIGAGAVLEDVVIGAMAVLESAAGQATVLTGYTAIGDEARVAAGSRLHGVRVYPRVRVQPGMPMSAGKVLTQHLSSVPVPPAAIAEATDFSSAAELPDAAG
jgi:NDP-sugar pyrophosphorylase family protein